MFWKEKAWQSLGEREGHFAIREDEWRQVEEREMKQVLYRK